MDFHFSGICQIAGTLSLNPVLEMGAFGSLLLNRTSSNVRAKGIIEDPGRGM
jgi:hypothetical protein